MARPALPFLLAAALAAAPPARPSLVVVISIDQFSAELMQTYGPELTGGLATLRKEGVWFTEAYHDHGFTDTGPGHSVLLSGRFPAHTGIVENRWYDRATGRTVYCVEDAQARDARDPRLPTASNRLFLGEGLGDWLQAQVPGSRVFSLAGKDRAAILMAGRKPTAVYWFSGPAGFTTASPYADRLPTWLARFDTDLAHRIATDSWLWRQDAATPNGRTAAWTFGSTTIRNGDLPRLVQGAGMPLDKGFDARFRRSPFLDQVTFEAADALLDAERPGKGPGTDLLTLSFSATDYIGHNYGQLGTEMRDQLHRLDRALGRLLTRLRAEHPDAWVVLSADHGGVDVPEVLAERGFPARRLAPEAFIEALQEDLKATFKATRNLLVPGPEVNTIYLDAAAIRAAGLDRAAVLKRAQAWARARPEVADAFTAEELQATGVQAEGSPRDTSLRVLLARSFRAERSGDLLLALKPYVVLGVPPKDYLANHGTPNGYDRRVPLIFWGPWKAAQRPEPVRTVDLAPTLARELGLKAGPVDGQPLDLGPRP